MPTAATLAAAAILTALSPPSPSLSPRLQAVHDAAARGGAHVADVGCDHGKLATALATSGLVAAVYACDQSDAALAKTARTLRVAGVADGRVRLRHGDGLSSLKPGDAVDTVVLAGLGVSRMQSILRAGLGRLPRCDAGAATVRKLVLQPISPRISQLAVLRATLRRLGFEVVAEHFCMSEGGSAGGSRPYLTLTALRSTIRVTSPPCSDSAKLLGPAPPLKDPIFRAFVHKERERLNAELHGWQRARSCVHGARQIRRLESRLLLIDGALGERPGTRGS